MFEVDNQLASRVVLDRLVPIVGVTPFPLHELMLMTAAVQYIRPSRIFEWGTNIGKSARVFYECLEAFEVDCQIHSVDLPDTASHVEHPREWRGQLVRDLNNVHLHQGDGATECVRIWQSDRRSDVLFFMDGDHVEDAVYRELFLIATEAPDADVLLHDTFFREPSLGYNVGPHRAIERVLELLPGRYRRIDSGLGTPGMTLLLRNKPRGS